MAINLYKLLIILVSIDTQRLVFNDAYLDNIAGAEDPQLFEIFQLLHRLDREVRELKEKRPAVGIDAEVLQEAGGARREVGLAVADKGDRTTAALTQLGL